ncbi:MAG: hypothetical protein A2234_05840 [Elusimicrobia bacterium RIFOXYA2_FULL_58_8]|nr:MAG: hypothetical protein A2234_05840 [Elusimicrobia bacterium RIFOXYA2_FULL_58_8]OGS13941.1 MAG: hypothetical protein A2285_02650 [Elusimicrobia bacterium RIFOXYA12_FULL_57_11]
MVFRCKFVPGVSAALLALLLAAGASSQTFGEGFFGELPTASSLENQPGVTPRPSPSTAIPSVELTSFWEKLKDGVSEPLCKKAEVALKKNVEVLDGAGLGGGVRRAIRRFPDGRLALIDEVKLNVFAVLGEESAILSETGGLIHQGAVRPEDVFFRMGLSGKLEGKSQVLQPLQSQSFCREVREWVKFYRLKTVLPAKAKRIVEMEVGEIWKLPLTMRMAFSVGAGANVAQTVNISLSAGLSKESKPSVSLRRLDADHLRLRLRLDRLQVASVGVAASTVEIPLNLLGLENAGASVADILLKTLRMPSSTWAAGKFINSSTFDKLLLNEINKYLSIKLAFAHSRFSGKKLLLEFILNPNNAEQMANLEEFLRGDLGLLNRFMELGVRFNSFAEQEDVQEGQCGLEDTAGQVGGELDAESGFAGTDVYRGRSNSLGIRVPFVGNSNVTWGSSYHRYQSLGNGGETIHAYHKNRTYKGSNLDIPFKGTFLKHNSQKDVYVLNKESTDGTVTRPVFLYQQYEGLIGRGTGEVKTMLEMANGVLRYVGVGGNGTDNGSQLPVGDILTESRRYRAGLMGFKLLINEGGVQDIVFAPAQAIVKAYMNVMRELYAGIIDKVMHLFTFDKKGRVTYDTGAAQAALGVTAWDEIAQGCNPLEIMDTLAYTATCVVADIAGVRDAPDWHAQSERLSRVAGGASKSGLKYEDFLKVAVQLTQPSNISASVYVHLDPKKKGVGNVTRNYDFFDSGNNSYDANISEVTQMRERFAEPSLLSD